MAEQECPLLLRIYEDYKASFPDRVKFQTKSKIIYEIYKDLCCSYKKGKCPLPLHCVDDYDGDIMGSDKSLLDAYYALMVKEKGTLWWRE